MKLVDVFVAGVVVGLAVSWAYILSLKATVRVCMTYIEDRIHNCTSRLEGTDDRMWPEGETQATGTDDRSTTSSHAERPTMAEQPLLIIESSGKGSPIHYQCSRCLRAFPLAKDDSPKMAAAELYRHFREHVAQEHA
jgi:hypothetical protein